MRIFAVHSLCAWLAGEVTYLPVADSIVVTHFCASCVLGNGIDQPLTVATLFNDPVSVNTLWKWDVVTTSWQFYTPSLSSAEMQAYAASKGYAVMTVTNPGEGYWVNAKVKRSFKAEASAPFKLGLIRSNRGGIWSPRPTISHHRPFSLWAWDNLQSKWYFYAPHLAGQGGSALTDYATSKGYLDFNATNKKLGQGIGFWVNKP